jgi:Fe2+ transport system protein FeoA
MDGIDVETYRMTNHVLDRLASMGVEPDEYLTTVARAICEDLAELLVSFLGES